MRGEDRGRLFGDCHSLFGHWAEQVDIRHGLTLIRHPCAHVRDQEGLTRPKAGYGGPDAFGTMAGTSHI